jgi:hypothetical protein
MAGRGLLWLVCPPTLGCCPPLTRLQIPPRTSPSLLTPPLACSPCCLRLVSRRAEAAYNKGARTRTTCAAANCYSPQACKRLRYSITDCSKKGSSGTKLLLYWIQFKQHRHTGKRESLLSSYYSTSPLLPRSGRRVAFSGPLSDRRRTSLHRASGQLALPVPRRGAPSLGPTCKNLLQARCRFREFARS